MKSLNQFKFSWNKLVGKAGVKVSLFLSDPIDSISYDSYIRQWLENRYPNYENYALGFWVNYSDSKQESWDVFVRLNGGVWELAKVPNPFYASQAQNRGRGRIKPF